MYLHSPTVQPKDIVRLSEDPLIQDSLTPSFLLPERERGKEREKEKERGRR